MAAQRKPNLILFLPDQQRADTLACYGGVKVHAPNLNKLASESVIFERTYVTHPVCTPSRSSLMTGTWPHINGCTHNSVPLDRRFRVFPELMQDRGLSDVLHRQMAPRRGRPYRTRIRALHFHRWSRRLQQFSYFKRHCTRQTKRPILGSSHQQSADRVIAAKVSRETRLRLHRETSARSFHFGGCVRGTAFAHYGSLNDVNPLDEVELDATATLSEHEDIPLRYRLMREWQQAEALLDRERLPIQLFFGITPDEYRSIKQLDLPRPRHVGRSKHRRDSWLPGTMQLSGRHHCGAHERPRRQPGRASSLWKRDDVRRSRARSVADSVAGPNAAEDDFTSSEPHRFRADTAGSSRAIKSSAVRGQKSVAVDQ